MKMNCTWTFEVEYWKTECGGACCFEAYGPDENGYEYCPYCGKRIIEQKEQGE
jgi:hypothetical protein